MGALRTAHRPLSDATGFRTSSSAEDLSADFSLAQYSLLILAVEANSCDCREEARYTPV
jgi:hypothetical protein